MTDKPLPCSHMYCCTGDTCWRNEALKLKCCIAELEERLDFVRSDRDHWERLVNNIRAANTRLVENEARLKEELARWRPSAPKFHVGQVVGVQHFVVKVASMHFLNYSNMWSYADTCGRGWEESQLRALTDEEK